MDREPATATALTPRDDQPVDVLYVVLPDTLLLDLAGPAEAFRLANQALQRRGRAPLFRQRYCGPLPAVSSSVGLTLAELEPLPARLSAPTWTVLLGRPGDTAQVLRRQRAWLQTRDWLARTLWPQVSAAGAPHRLLTVCVGALLAADAGLIGERRCTTHHELLDELAQLAPKAQVLANRLFVEDGPLLSSAGITAGIDLALHCIAQLGGDALAASVAQVMVVQGRRHTQDPQRSPLLAFRDHLHPAVHRVQEAVCERPGDPWPAEALSAIAHVTPRQLTRLFHEHTGLTPRAYVEHVRVALAQQALRRGASGQQAADLAGFSSDRQWRRAKARHAVGQAHHDAA
ncbi:GlxA family transcriptional regulator [Aquabacterium sp.]|uniref:GlxA family transcriptional regulator n=1 Tax=Aquabacterium sp. TaxID=1872578 RepID=UPI00378427B3